MARLNRVVAWVTVVGVAGLLAGCGGDPRIKNLTAGITKDSAMKAMGAEKPQRISPYLSKGQYIETIYYPLPGKTDSESVKDRKMTPVVAINGKVTGWGWTYWDSVAADHKIEVVPK